MPPASGRLPALGLVAALFVWAMANTWAVLSGVAAMRGPDLVVSYIGIAAVIAFSVVITGNRLGAALAYCGRHSIAIYLAFTLFMAPVRSVLVKLLGMGLLDAVALATMAASIGGALVLRWGVSRTPLAFLFVRPAAFRLAARGKVSVATGASVVSR